LTSVLRALRQAANVGLVLSLALSCSTSPRTLPSDSTASPASPTPPLPSPAPSGPPGGSTAPPVSATSPGGSRRPTDTASPPRVTIVASIDAKYIVEFPTSISERGDRIAAIVSVEDNCESRCDEWLIIKDVKKDKIEHAVVLIDAELSSKIGWSCVDAWSTCAHRFEVERRVEAANAVLARDRWRRLPCFNGTWRPDRIEGGCEQFSGLDVRFEDPRLVISHQGRVLLDRRVPSWIYRDSSCKQAASTDIESFALDPETGILVVGLQFWSQVEGCAVPRWDFHPISMPILRRKAPRDRDGGAP
jgi:hypothetical protein